MNENYGPDENAFEELFKTYNRQLVAFFRARRCQWDEAEDLAQEVMLKVHQKASQLRDGRAFRGWLFTIAKNELCEHFRQQRNIRTVTLDDLDHNRIPASEQPAGSPAFEFLHWMGFLDESEREIMQMRFLEHQEYHEIADSKSMPTGTIQWKVFNAKKKLVPYLTTPQRRLRRAA